MVFQSDTLFPSMSVAENVAFGLRARSRRPDAEAVDVALLRMGLSGLAAASRTSWAGRAAAAGDDRARSGAEPVRAAAGRAAKSGARPGAADG